MRDVAQAQAESGRYGAVALGIVASEKWPERYAEELKGLGLPYYRAATVNVFGTAQFLWQKVQAPPIGAWARVLMECAGASAAIVHIHNAWLSGVFLPLKNGQAERIKVVVTFHGVCTTLERQPVRRWLHRRMAQGLLRHNATLTSVDAGNLPLARKIFALPPERFHVVTNGVKADATTKAAAWTGTGEFMVGYAGLLAEHKGWRLVAEAVLRARAGGRRVRLLIAGAGAQEAQARAMAQAHPEAIEFVGFVSAPRKNLFPRLHALSLMSLYEGLPMILIEAASVGLPVIATDVGGVREIVEDGVSGMLVGRSVERLVAAIEHLYDHPAEAAQMGMAARAAHAARFEIGKVAEQYDDVYATAWSAERWEETAGMAARLTATIP